MTDKLWRCPCFTWSKIPCYWTELSFQAQAEEIVSLPTIDATPSWEWDASKLFQDDLTVSFIKPSMCRLPLFTDARASFFIWQWGLERGPYAASGGAGMPFFFSPLCHSTEKSSLSPSEKSFRLKIARPMSFSCDPEHRPPVFRAHVGVITT